MEILKIFSPGARPSKADPTPTGETGYNLSIKRSSMKETTLQTHMPTRREMLKAKNCISEPYGDLSHEPRRHENDGKLFQQKASENSPKPSMMVKAADYDELVRYMSNVPGYLQRVEKKEDMKGKALNVGVLDWGRLENYKCSQKGIAVGIGNGATLPCINLSTEMATGLSVPQNPRGIETPYGNKQRLSSSSKHNSCANGDFFRNATLSSQDAEFSNDEHRVAAAPNYRSSVTNNSDKTLAKSKRRDLDDKITSKVEHQPSKTKHKRVPVRPKGSQSSCDRAKQTVDDLQGLDIKREAPKQVFTPNMGTSAFNPTDRSSGSKKEKLNIGNCGTENPIGLQETAGNPPRQHHADKSRNIVLLLPRPANSFPNQTRMSQDENVPDAKQNFLSDAFSDRGAFSAELRDEIPHSCPLPSRNYATAEKKMGPDATNTVDAEASSNVINATTRERLDETSKMSSQETVESATRKGINRSPNRRFSFSSLSQMTRSFSFRENSALLPLSSTYVSVKSGPVTSTSSAGMVDLNREKECGHIRARSSPLRRILDPLLPKFKGRTSSFSDEADQQSRSRDSIFKPIKVAESLENEMTKASSMQAQLVITISNGLPVYRFVTNSSIMIAAPLKNAIAPGKDDPQSNYVLHSINEIKKKSGSWINQASKEKTCFVYNAVGEMKLNRKPSLSGENLENQELVKESVLIGVEPRQTGQALPKGMPNTELAAVIMKKPSGFMGYDVHCSDKEDSVKNNICTVVLPGGIHSLPKTGVPSSLVHRWKSGGSCDCGGWDIGCRLHILSNDIQQPKLSRTFSSFLRSDCLELFVQGETQQKKPIFSMAPFGKEKYSVEFSSSISLLQAFFIGVSVITCQRSSDLTEDSYMSEDKAFWKSSNGIDCLKTSWKDTPMKYTPTPPLSPVGRV